MFEHNFWLVHLVRRGKVEHFLIRMHRATHNLQITFNDETTTMCRGNANFFFHMLSCYSEFRCASFRRNVDVSQVFLMFIHSKWTASFYYKFYINNFQIRFDVGLKTVFKASLIELELNKDNKVTYSDGLAILTTINTSP